MTKKRKIAYWIFTTLLSLGMLSGGIAQVLEAPQNKEGIVRLGYPVYLMTIIGVWKIVGVAAVMLPGLALAKEWAYAGFFFVLSGAAISHVAHGDPLAYTVAPLALLGFTILSWYLRPEDRRVRQE
jgi:uncharacterized membrane protein YphA (DoxX/SURF4 family)